MKPLRISIDPGLRVTRGPEICWVWRTIFASIGHSWQEVDIGDECDIAYGERADYPGPARLRIHADTMRWQSMHASPLKGVDRTRGRATPIFEDGPGRLETRRDDGGVLCERDVIFDVFGLLTGLEEATWERGPHGFADLRSTPWQANGAFRLALGSAIVCELSSALAAFGHQGMVPRWPAGKHAALAVTHDVDNPEVVRAVEPLRQLGRQGARGTRGALDLLLGRRSHWHFDEWIRLDRRLGARPAFYFAARRGSLRAYLFGRPDPFYDIRTDRFRELFARLTEAGSEIGLHASYESYRDLEQLEHEIDLLAKCSGGPIVGNRHHYFHLDPQDPEATLLEHEHAGLIYDLSLGHNFYTGWRRSFVWPFSPFHRGQRREIGTLQLGTAWMDDQVFGYRHHNPGLPTEILDQLLDTALDQEGCVIIDFHEWVLDDTLFPGWAKVYEHVVQRATGSSQFWVATPKEIAAHWLERTRLILQDSSGLTGGA